MQSILLTGGAGFIGSNLTKKLLLSGQYSVTCIDNFDDFYERRQKDINIQSFKDNPDYKIIEGDIRNVADLEKVGHVDTIVHLAAKAGVRPSIEHPVLYQDVNVAGTQNLLEFARQKKIQQFVFASSSSVYGVNPDVPWSEEMKLYPISPYASTKLSGEMLGHVYSQLYGIRFVALRFFTVYGPSQRPDLAIHKFFKSISRKEPIPFYGDGNTSRDYTFVEDTVQGIEAAIEYKASDFEIINLGNHQTVTLSELVAAIEDTCGIRAIIKRLPEQPGDVPRTFADISKAKALLRYDPQTNLADGLKKFHNWFVEQNY
jgi:UDP-glucuronate 4-epimerase